MNDARQQPNQRARRESSGPRPLSDAVDQAIEPSRKDLSPRLPKKDGTTHGMIQIKGNTDAFTTGGILVDVDGGPGGKGLVVWIVGG